MLNITPQQQRDLGKAVLVIEDGVLYITDGHHWMLVLPSPDGWIPPQVLEMVREFDTNRRDRVLDWRILNAKTVDFTNETFLPHQARKHAPLWFDTYRNFSGVRGSLREGIEVYEPSLYGDLVNLEEVFAGGNARAVYKETPSQRKSKEGRVFAKEESAEHYVFRFDDKIIGINGSQLRAFRELGFIAVCPKEAYGTQPIPPIGLQFQGGLDAFGFTMPQAELGIFEDNQGRKLFADAATVSWRVEQACLEGLCHPNNYLFHEGQPMSLGDILETSWGHVELKRDVSALMWKGWPVEDIDRAYEEARYSAYVLKDQEMQSKIRAHIESLKAPEAPVWHTRNIESELDRFCTLYESMTHLVEFSLGMLPDAIDMLGSVLDEPETTSMRA